ncbi:MAG: hypothetical protein SOV89_06970 [Candidatus Egerieousia sp.]|nr:hypothetical protein [Candidatus Egerieousia sp.]
MKRYYFILFALCLSLALSLFSACSKEVDEIAPDQAEWTLKVSLSDMQNGTSAPTKISYSGTFGEHSEFETGDSFGLFVLYKNNENKVVIKFKNLKVYCSGFDNKGKSVWSIYKPLGGNGESPNGESSNYPISEILSSGSLYYAYYPYKEGLETTITTLEALKNMVPAHMNNLPMDQSDSYTKYDLLVASNISDCKYGEILLEGKNVRVTLAHTMSMLRYLLPKGSIKYDYFFGGKDFTPNLFSTAGDKEEYRFIFKPGQILDICIKYVNNNKLYKIETGNLKNLYAIITKAGYSYFLDRNFPLIPYEVAIDMGTSVMWSPFNLGVEREISANAENAMDYIGKPVMWGANQYSDNFGANAYGIYCSQFTTSTPPNKLPKDSNISGNSIYDAASNMWGGEWRIPTSAEWEELFSACTYSIADGKITFTSKSTGKTITLKYAGYYDSATPTATNTGYYWSATSNATDSTKSIATQFAATNTAPKLHTTANRYTGLPVRPVYSKNH